MERAEGGGGGEWISSNGEGGREGCKWKGWWCWYRAHSTAQKRGKEQLGWRRLEGRKEQQRRISSYLTLGREKRDQRRGERGEREGPSGFFFTSICSKKVRKRSLLLFSSPLHLISGASSTFTSPPLQSLKLLFCAYALLLEKLEPSWLALLLLSPQHSPPPPPLRLYILSFSFLHPGQQPFVCFCRTKKASQPSFIPFPPSLPPSFCFCLFMPALFKACLTGVGRVEVGRLSV